MAIFLYIKPQ